MLTPGEQRRANLYATLCALNLPAVEPELVSLHRAFDSWAGIGQLEVGLARKGFEFSLTHIGPNEWRCYLMDRSPMLAPRGFGVASTPWRAVQMAGWAALKQESDAAEAA